MTNYEAFEVVKFYCTKYGKVITSAMYDSEKHTLDCDTYFYNEAGGYVLEAGGRDWKVTWNYPEDLTEVSPGSFERMRRIAERCMAYPWKKS
jgi:hypothetical protein